MGINQWYIVFVENGLEFVFDVKTSLNISDISFFPSQRLHTYDLYASCADKDEILFLNLESGKCKKKSVQNASISAFIRRFLIKVFQLIPQAKLKWCQELVGHFRRVVFGEVISAPYHHHHLVIFSVIT